MVFPMLFATAVNIKSSIYFERFFFAISMQPRKRKPSTRFAFQVIFGIYGLSRFLIDFGYIVILWAIHFNSHLLFGMSLRKKRFLSLAFNKLSLIIILSENAKRPSRPSESLLNYRQLHDEEVI